MRRSARLSVDDVARYPRPGNVVPGEIRFTPDGGAVSYLLAEGDSLERSLWLHDVASGERRVLAGPGLAEAAGEPSREEELRRERARLRETGITAYEWATEAAERILLVPVGGAVMVGVGDGPLRDVESARGGSDAHLAPDGSRLAFVRDGNLWVADVAGGDPRRLTHDAEDGVTNGVAEYIAAEELDRDRGYWWSRDGRRIGFVRADSRGIPPYPIVHQGTDAVEVEHHRYPFAGAGNAELRLGIVDVATGEITWLDLGADAEYVARVAWRPDGRLAAELLSRDQRTLRIVAFGTDGAADRLLEERGDPWLNLDDGARHLRSGELLFTSERSGYRHLYVHAPDGSPPRQLTDGAWVVTRVAGVDEERRVAYVEGTRDGAVERHLYRVSLQVGETARRLTGAGGWHTTVVADDGSRFVDTHSSLERAPAVTLHDLRGAEEPVELFVNPLPDAAAAGLRPPRLIEVQAADGTPLDAALYEPAPATGREGPPPLVVSVYGGPHAQRVADDWTLTVDLRAQYLAQEGCLVLKVDGRGSANRGLAFEAPLHRRMGTVEIDDQSAAVEQLVARGAADGGRIGVYGWSYGGYVTLLCMLRRPDLFRAGVAGAPVTDWAAYDTAYTERYMGMPAESPDGYREASVLTHVEGLAGDLLVVHGMIDENVHFRHTARLLRALAAAGRECDLLIYPEERHMPRDAAGLAHQERRVLGHLLHRLAVGRR